MRDRVEDRPRPFVRRDVAGRRNELTPAAPSGPSAASTDSRLRPLTATRAPAPASAAAMAAPMPCVEPVTSAVLPERSISTPIPASSAAARPVGSVVLVTGSP